MAESQSPTLIMEASRHCVHGRRREEDQMLGVGGEELERGEVLLRVLPCQSALENILARGDELLRPDIVRAAGALGHVHEANHDVLGH